jgi:hypothetical protein
MQIANADAIPLFFLMLKEADESDAAWGLALWYRLAADSLVNAHACKRADLFPFLLEWFAATHPAPGGAGGRQPTAGSGSALAPPSPRLQIRLAALMQVLAPHAMSMTDFRRLLQVMQPEALEGGTLWGVQLARLQTERSTAAADRKEALPVLSHTSLLAQKMLCRCDTHSCACCTVLIPQFPDFFGHPPNQGMLFSGWPRMPAPRRSSTSHRTLPPASYAEPRYP